MGCHCKNAHTFQMNSALPAYQNSTSANYNAHQTYFYPLHAQDGTVKIDISLPVNSPGACPILPTNPTINRNATNGRLSNAAQNL